MPARVIRECTAALGEPADRYLGVSEMADGTDKANGNKSARGIYNLLYGLISSSPSTPAGPPSRDLDRYTSSTSTPERLSRSRKHAGHDSSRDLDRYRGPGQRISPGRMTWTRFSARTP